MDYRIKSFIKARRCVETARRRCVFKIYNVTRLKIFAPQTAFGPVYLGVIISKSGCKSGAKVVYILGNRRALP